MEQTEISKSQEDNGKEGSVADDMDSEERLNMLNKKYGWRTLIGGFFMHALLGCLYSYGNICLYVASVYFKYNHFDVCARALSVMTPNTIGSDQSLAYMEALVVFPLQFIFISIAMPIGVQILEGISMLKSNQSLMPIWTPMTIGSVFLIGGVFLSSFVMSNRFLFSIFHGAFFGIGYGLCYMAPI